jgi:hypothetical protein
MCTIPRVVRKLDERFRGPVRAIVKVHSIQSDETASNRRRCLWENSGLAPGVRCGAMEDMLMMEHPPAAFIAGRIDLQLKKLPRTLTTVTPYPSRQETTQAMTYCESGPHC